MGMECHHLKKQHRFWCLPGIEHGLKWHAYIFNYQWVTTNQDQIATPSLICEAASKLLGDGHNLFPKCFGHSKVLLISNQLSMWSQ